MPLAVANPGVKGSGCPGMRRTRCRRRSSAATLSGGPSRPRPEVDPPAAGHCPAPGGRPGTGRMISSPARRNGRRSRPWRSASSGSPSWSRSREITRPRPSATRRSARSPSSPPGCADPRRHPQPPHRAHAHTLDHHRSRLRDPPHRNADPLQSPRHRHPSRGIGNICRREECKLLSCPYVFQPAWSLPSCAVAWNVHGSDCCRCLVAGRLPGRRSASRASGWALGAFRTGPANACDQPRHSQDQACRGDHAGEQVL